MKASSLSREKAAQAWCTETTKHKVMDVDLAEAFAEILEEIWTQPWLGNATNEQLLDELRARIPLNYKTTGGELSSAPCTKPNEPV
jgi:hypothetical protein